MQLNQKQIDAISQAILEGFVSIPNSAELFYAYVLNLCSQRALRCGWALRSNGQAQMGDINGTMCLMFMKYRAFYMLKKLDPTFCKVIKKNRVDYVTAHFDDQRYCYPIIPANQGRHLCSILIPLDNTYPDVKQMTWAEFKAVQKIWLSKYTKWLKANKK